MEALTGEWCQPADHRIQLAGRELSAAGPLARRKAGVCFIPEERNGHAAVPSMNLAENALLTSYEDAKTVSGGVISQQETLLAAEKIARTFDVRGPSANPLASALSGGNLQKFGGPGNYQKAGCADRLATYLGGGCRGGAIHPQGHDRAGRTGISGDYDLTGSGRDFCHFPQNSGAE